MVFFLVYGFFGAVAFRSVLFCRFKVVVQGLNLKQIAEFEAYVVSKAAIGFDLGRGKNEF